MGRTRDGRHPARPRPPCHDPRVRNPRTTRSGAAAALALALAVLPMRPAAADPPSADGRMDALLTELRTLHQSAGAATDAYNAAQERVRAHTARVRHLTHRLARARAALAAERADLGRLARRQYRGEYTVFPPYVRLLLGQNPRDALSEARLLGRLAQQRTQAVTRVERAERRLRTLRRDAKRAVAAQRALVAERRAQRDAARQRINRAERLLTSLRRPERDRLRHLESARVRHAQTALTSQFSLAGARSPSAAGQRALRYAMRQLGKPYAMGKAGPDAFDCSGLTSRAWAHAGHPIPRTSQAQWRELPRVPLNRLRPGDLVVYFPDASHVGLYAGGGKVVHAPRPGRAVEVAPMAMNPVLGAVRPDGGG